MTTVGQDLSEGLQDEHAAVKSEKVLQSLICIADCKR